jgi:SAM domain (Sterile alpha motif)
MQQIAEWLKDLGMPEHLGRFAENRIDISVLPDLTEPHLKDLGVALGDRFESAARDPRSRQRFGCRQGAPQRAWRPSQLSEPTPSAAG